RPAGVVVPVAEREVAALRDVLVAGRLPLPEVPVQLLRHRRLGERSAVQPRGQDRLDPGELADPAVADQLAGLPEARVAALLAAGLEDALGVAPRRDEALALVDRQRERLLAVDVLARLEGGEVDQRVPVVGGAVDDDMDVLALQQLTEVLVDRRALV